MENNIIINGNCWIACFDILGFKNNVKEFEQQAGIGRLNVFVKNFYSKIINELKQQNAYHPNDVFSTWFSDTFIFFTRDDSEQAFSLLQSTFDISYWFVITKDAKWPLRGAIGYGQLYADISKNIFLGSGIINAYEYAEKQNWIGSIVTPEANNKLVELGIDLSRRRFTKYPVPLQQKKDGSEYTLELFVSRIHNNRPEVIKAIKLMQQEAMRDKNYQKKLKRKYENTLKFFDGQANSTYFLCSLWQKIKNKIK
jgi:hypothetical protein